MSRRGHRSGRCGDAAHERSVRDDARRLRGQAIEADCGSPNHDWIVAVVSKRSGQPRHRACHAGCGPNARPRLDVRASALRPRADERHGRRHVPRRRAPHHRHRSNEVARRPCAGQPRSAFGHVVDCCRSRR